MIYRMKRKWTWLCGVGAGILCLIGIVSLAAVRRHKPGYQLRCGENSIHISLFRGENTLESYVFTVNDPAPFAITHSCGQLSAHIGEDQQQTDYDIQVNVSRMKEGTMLYLARVRDGTVRSVDAYRLWAEDGMIRCAAYDTPDKLAEFERYRRNRSELESMA